MGFEKFVPRATPSKAAPQVTVRKSGLVSFDATAVKEFDLVEATHLVLLFDKTRKLLGIRATRDSEEDGALPLSRRRRTASVKVPQFFERWGLLLDDVQKFDVAYDSSEKILVIDLSAVKRRRGRRPKNL